MPKTNSNSVHRENPVAIDKVMLRTFQDESNLIQGHSLDQSEERKDVIKMTPFSTDRSYKNKNRKKSDLSLDNIKDSASHKQTIIDS